MTCWRDWLPISLWLFAGAGQAAVDAGVITLADGDSRLLRGATWYKLAPGVGLQDADILTGGARSQVQVEFTGGTLASFAGEGALMINVAKDGALALTLTAGALKVAVKGPPVRVRTTQFEASVADGIVVMRADGGELFVEAGSAKLSDASGAREAKRGEYWVKSAAGFATKPLAPKPFVESLPRNFLDPLPVLAPGLKSRAVPAVDRDITFAEAEPWLARDRAAFEKRFASRLRDPAFRKAVEPVVARYPSWDRMLHPEKYQPKQPQASQ
ncbi:MAG TPA: hypothetical protein VMI74_04900 [Burkholderiales bacterium]|nr:hypothetical protein [Burkholderiales bacterium]